MLGLAEAALKGLPRPEGVGGLRGSRRGPALGEPLRAEAFNAPLRRVVSSIACEGVNESGKRGAHLLVHPSHGGLRDGERTVRGAELVLPLTRFRRVCLLNAVMEASLNLSIDGRWRCV